jgi:regulator of nucleoside diphosphate kinase
MEVSALERTLTDLDHVRIKNLVRRDRSGRSLHSQAPLIEDVLDAYAIVPSRKVSPDIVTMNSQVLLLDRASGKRHKFTLCYPADAEPGAGFVSVLSPLGWSLLGLRVGCVARWSTPTGGEGAAEVLAILFQPEASGDYAM